VFGPQKGADRSTVGGLEAGLTTFASILCAQLDIEPASPGAGAAGGTGFGLMAWGAHLVPGGAAVADLIGLRAAVAAASIVLTGEGSYDAQSANGKAPAHVAALASEAGAAVALVAGRITADADISRFAAAVALTELAGSGGAAMADPRRWLSEAGVRLAEGL
jgi:glycerate kinase